MKELREASFITAIKTPYLESGGIDFQAFDHLAELQIEAGVDGFVVSGTTGEGHLMNWEEHLSLIAHSVYQFGSRVVIIGNTGSNNTREAWRATSKGFAVGMTASLQINPYYGKTSTAGLHAHFSKIFDLGPCIIYNVPPRTNQDIDASVMQDLARHKHFIGVKECAGNDRIAQYAESGILAWSGNDNQCFDARHQYGAVGVISVMGNIIPEAVRQLMDSADQALHESLKPLIQWLFCEPNPIPLNTALAMVDLIQPVFRLPYVPLEETRRKQGADILKNLQHVLGSTPNILTDTDFILV